MAQSPGNHVPKLEEVHAGFIPLTDCAPLVIAKECGFDREYGFSLILHREVSWANIRDKVDIGIFDCAHMLAPMPLAATLGLGHATEPVIAPMALSLNGNAITVSTALHAQMLKCDPQATQEGGMAAGRALATVVRNRRSAGQEPLTLGMVYPFSCHNYDLRYWLTAAGIDPDDDVNLVVIPPPLIAESLRAGRVDGFCAGQPWNSVAVSQGTGAIIATKSQLWGMSPEKVLGIRESWAERHPRLTEDLICALTTAARWLDVPTNRREAARILSDPRYVGIADNLILSPLTGTLRTMPGKTERHDPDFVVFHNANANFPWRSHAVWMMTQMIRWGQAREPFELKSVAARVFRPDIFREAVAKLDMDEVPRRDYKREGRHQQKEPSPSSGPSANQNFFGEEMFDPDAPIAYLRDLAIRSPAADLDGFAALNP
jgi:two-component system, oxyanion-binding sensor